MPKEMERRLRREAEKQGLTPGSKEYDAYVYGTLAKIEKGKEERRDA